jgi:hypothetical protein
MKKLFVLLLIALTTGATAMAQADDVSGLVAIEWYPFGGRMDQYITNIKIGGTTSFAKAIQY